MHIKLHYEILPLLPAEVEQEREERKSDREKNGQISSNDKINYYLQLTMWNGFIASLDRFYAINSGHVFSTLVKDPLFPLSLSLSFISIAC